MQRSRCDRWPVLPLVIWLALVISLSAALAQDEPNSGAQPGRLQVKKSAQVSDWRTITVGACKGVDAHRKALALAGIKLGDSADEILGRPAFPYALTTTDLQLAVLSAADLGLNSESPSLADVYNLARHVGLELCPAEVGPQLRLEYRDQIRATRGCRIWRTKCYSCWPRRLSSWRRRLRRSRNNSWLGTRAIQSVSAWRAFRASALSSPQPSPPRW